jgi:hypothetical protein
MGLSQRQDGYNTAGERRARVGDRTGCVDHGGITPQITARQATLTMTFEPVPEFGGTRISVSGKPIDRMRMSSVITIIVSAGHGGSITPSSRVSIGYGLSKMFAITPRWGYSISDVQVDGVSVGSVITYTFSNLTEDHTISATFRKDF